MFRAVMLLLLTGCFPNRAFKKDFITLTESPCADGTILNIYEAGCVSFYWGALNEGQMLKVRCGWSPENNWWTTNSFYMVRRDSPVEYTNWSLFCSDRITDVYVAPTRVQLEEK